MNSDKSSFVTPEKTTNLKDLPAIQLPSLSTKTKIAKPLHVQALERQLDLNPFLDQLEQMFARPIQSINAIWTGSISESSPSISSIKLWTDDAERKRDMAEFYNFKTVGKRKWLRNLLLEDSGSESDEQITDTDIKILLKIHKYRRKYQKRYHTDIMNSQCTYYAAGLLSEYDYHAEHQAFITEQYGFSSSPEFVASVNALSSADDKASSLPTSKRPPNSGAIPDPSSAGPSKTSSILSVNPSSGATKRRSCGTFPPTHPPAQSKRRESAPKSTNVGPAFVSRQVPSDVIARPQHHQQPIVAPMLQNTVALTTTAKCHAASASAPKKSRSSSKSNSMAGKATVIPMTLPSIHAYAQEQQQCRSFSTNAKFGQTSLMNQQQQQKTPMVVTGPPNVTLIPNGHNLAVGTISRPRHVGAALQPVLASCQPPLPPPQLRPAALDPRFKAIWKTIVNELLPKACNEKYIAKTYRAVVLKNIAMSCAAFLQQSKNSQSPSKTKNRQKRKNELTGLRPINLPANRPDSLAGPSNSGHFSQSNLT